MYNLNNEAPSISFINLFILLLLQLFQDVSLSLYLVPLCFISNVFFLFLYLSFRCYLFSCVTLILLLDGYHNFPSDC